MNKEALRLSFRNIIYLPLTCKFRRKRIHNDKFTIISNNCWGGTVYESYGLMKNTPTVGLFFAPEDFLKFIKNMKYYLSQEMHFIQAKESKLWELKKNSPVFGTYPIGVLDDVEIHFLHYHSEEEAIDKWSRRSKRIIWDKILYKFNDQNGCTPEMIKEFAELNIKNKVCFTVLDGFENYDCVYRIKNCPNPEYVLASYEPFGSSRIVNINGVINAL